MRPNRSYDTLTGELDTLRSQLAAAEQRAAVAEERAAGALAVAAERERVIQTQAMALRMLEASKNPAPATPGADACQRLQKGRHRPASNGHGHDKGQAP
jgi:hypothetical protein